VLDQSILPVAQELLTCFCTSLNANPDPPEICCLRVGQRVSALISANDDECCRGLAWVRVVSDFPSNDFPEQLTTPIGNCPPGWLAVILEMGVLRCAPAGTIFDLPTCPEWTALFTTLMNDSAAMRDAFCCLDLDVSAKLLGIWEPLEVEGGCTGGTRTVTVWVPSCLDC